MITYPKERYSWYMGLRIMYGAIMPTLVDRVVQINFNTAPAIGFYNWKEGSDAGRANIVAVFHLKPKNK